MHMEAAECTGSAGGCRANWGGAEGTLGRPRQTGGLRRDLELVSAAALDTKSSPGAGCAGPHTPGGAPFVPGRAEPGFPAHPPTTQSGSRMCPEAGLTLGHVSGEPACHVAAAQGVALAPRGPGGAAPRAQAQPHGSGNRRSAARKGDLAGGRSRGRTVPGTDGSAGAQDLANGSGVSMVRTSLRMCIAVPAPTGVGRAHRAVLGLTGYAGRGQRRSPGTYRVAYGC